MISDSYIKFMLITSKKLPICLIKSQSLCNCHHFPMRTLLGIEKMGKLKPTVALDKVRRLCYIIAKNRNRTKTYFYPRKYQTILLFWSLHKIRDISELTIY